MRANGGPEVDRFPVVGIGASAGGLEACRMLLGALPLESGCAFVIVQHLDPLHDSALTDILSRATALTVVEATDGVRVRPNHVYVIPPNGQLAILDGVLKLRSRDAGSNGPGAIDRFFESLAADRQERAMGVVLSGNASDGTLGLEAVRAEGGVTFAQDATAKYGSMPRSAIAAGCVDFVLPPAEIATTIARLAQHPAINGAAADSVARDGGDAAPVADSITVAVPTHASTPHRRGDTVAFAAGDREAFDAILQMVHERCGVDFT
ncbi:MAG TPA: chemotaxis protein CheB, partial [Acidobacteriota bacterium]|nr:chemotaxis protein CheB [Acidobacteriota bacterium]